MLKAVRPYIKTFDNYAYQRMPEKEFCVAVTWGPDGLLAMSGAEEANTGVTLDFFLPAIPQTSGLTAGLSRPMPRMSKTLTCS